MRKRILANLLFFTFLAFVMIAWAISNVVTIRQIEGPYAISGQFLATGGVGKNAEVTYLGVPIGTVTGVERMAGGVIVKMEIDKGRKIPVGSNANLQRKSAIGEPIVDFRPPAAGAKGPFMTKGMVVPLADTTIPLEFSDLLMSASRLIASIPPEQLATLLHEAAVGLQGNDGVLRQLTDASDELGTTLLSRTDAFNRLAQNNTAITKLLADKSATVNATFADLDLLAKTLRDAKTDTNRLLDETPRFLSETSGLVETVRPDLDCTLDVVGQVLDQNTTDRKLKEMHALLTIGPTAFRGLYDALDLEKGTGDAVSDGAWIRVGLVSSSTNLPPEYAPPRALPAAVPPKVCARSAAALPSGVDYTPGAGGGSSLPATGRDAGLGLGLLLVLAALIARAGLRDPAPEGRA